MAKLVIFQTISNGNCSSLKLACKLVFLGGEGDDSNRASTESWMASLKAGIWRASFFEENSVFFFVEWFFFVLEWSSVFFVGRF